MEQQEVSLSRIEHAANELYQQICAYQKRRRAERHDAFHLLFSWNGELALCGPIGGTKRDLEALSALRTLKNEERMELFDTLLELLTNGNWPRTSPTAELHDLYELRLRWRFDANEHSEWFLESKVERFQDYGAAPLMWIECDLSKMHMKG